eukprot:2412427-Amphidinium_carterae.1
MGHALCRPTPFFQPLALHVSQDALKDASTWELLDYLSRTGWALKRKPRGRLLPYTPGADKVWYASGVTLERSSTYMQALAVADTLFEANLEVVHHGQKQNYYQQILDGGSGLLPDVLHGHTDGLDTDGHPRMLDSSKVKLTLRTP